MKISEGAVLRQLAFARRRRLSPRSLMWICVQLGVQRGPDGLFAKAAWYHYVNIGRHLQRLKRAGKVVYVSKAQGGPGWRLFKP